MPAPPEGHKIQVVPDWVCEIFSPSTKSSSEVMRRIAAPMVGGMVSATVLTLLIIPAAFLLWKGIRIRRGLKLPSAMAEVPVA